MKITQYVVAILFTSFLFQGSQQACLTAAQLNALGFTVGANITSAGNSSSVCTDLYSNGGNCVDVAQIQTVFNTNQVNLQANAQASVNINTALNSVLTAINSLTNLAGNITANITAALNGTLTNLTTNTSVTANATARTLQTTTSTTVNASAGSNLQTIINNSNKAINSCYQAYQNLVNGVYCYLTSNQASANTAVTTSGTTTNFVVNVNTDSTRNTLNACIPVIDSYCLLTYGISITSNTTAFTSFFQNSVNSTGKVSLATCQILQSNYNCNSTTCQTAINTALINTVFSPTSVNFIQSKAFTDARASAVTNVGAFFGLSRRLQASPNNSSNVQTQSNSTGEDVTKHGQNSGANSTTYGASAKLFGAIFALLVTFLYA